MGWLHPRLLTVAGVVDGGLPCCLWRGQWTRTARVGAPTTALHCLAPGSLSNFSVTRLLSEKGRMMRAGNVCPLSLYYVPTLYAEIAAHFTEEKPCSTEQQLAQAHQPVRGRDSIQTQA